MARKKIDPGVLRNDPGLRTPQVSQASRIIGEHQAATKREMTPGPMSPRVSKPAKIGKLASGPQLGPVPSADTETGNGSASVPPGFRRA